MGSMLLRVDGPTGHRNFILEPGAAPLVAGRGTDTDIRLPDSLRSISRRHLSFALEGEGARGCVRVLVISEALGAWSTQGELPPASNCLLAAGDHLVIGEYRISVQHSETTPHLLKPTRSPGPAGPSTPPAPTPIHPLGTAPGEAEASPLSLDALLSQPAGPPAREGDPRAPGPADPSLDLLDLIMPREGAPLAPPAQAATAFLGHAFHVQPTAAEPPRRDTAKPTRSPAGSAEAEGRAAVAHASGEAPDAASPHDAVLDFLSRDTRTGNADTSAPLDTPPETPLLIHMAAPDPQDWSEPASSTAAPAATPATAADGLAGDIWSQLDHLAASVQSLPPGPLPAAATDGETAAAAPKTISRTEQNPACRALAQGLGIDLPETLSEADWQHVGATLKALVEGYANLLHARDSVRSTLGVPGRTEVFNHDNNPLKLRATPAMRLSLMALPQPDERRYLPAARAIAEATQDLQDHNMAIIAACRVAMEELVHSFDPQRWESAEGGGKRLPILGEAQLWRRYREHYQQQTQHMADLIQRLFEQHFVNAYSRGLDRPRGHDGGARG
jgi:type VI secretion system protein ImpI